MENPIDIAIKSKVKFGSYEEFMKYGSNKDGWIVCTYDDEDLLCLEQDQSKEEYKYVERLITLKNKLLSTKRFDSSEFSVRLIFEDDSIWFPNEYYKFFNKIDFKRIRGDRDVVVGDSIESKQGLSAKVLAITEKDIILSQRGTDGPNAVTYTHSFFWMAAQKGERLFKGELPIVIEESRFDGFLPEGVYLSKYRTSILKSAEEIKEGDVVVVDGEGSKLFKVTEFNNNTLMLLPKEKYDDDYSISYGMDKPIVILITKTNQDKIFYLNGPRFPRFVSLENIKSQLGF